MIPWALGALALVVAIGCAWAAIGEASRDADAPPRSRSLGDGAHLPARRPRSFAAYHRRLRRQMRHAERAMHDHYRGGHLK